MINELEKEFEKLKKIYNEYVSKEQLKLNKIDNNKFYKIENTQQLKYLVYKKSIIIENKQNLNIFTSKEIQDENKEITRNFQKEAFNYMNYEEETENENVAFFLIDVAKTSRKSYLEADKLFKSLFEKYSKSSQNKGISSLDNDKGKKEFSSWVKQYEKSNNIQENENSLKNEKKYFYLIYYIN